MTSASSRRAADAAAGRCGDPILRFGDVPRSVAVEVVDRPGQPFLGNGEASQGPAAAALGNALADAIGERGRSLPLQVRDPH